MQKQYQQLNRLVVHFLAMNGGSIYSQESRLHLTQGASYFSVVIFNARFASTHMFFY